MFKGLQDRTMPCWMSHGDSAEALPPGFDVIGSTENTEIAAIARPEKKLYGLQFHPEVEHTPRENRSLKIFCLTSADASPTGP